MKYLLLIIAWIKPSKSKIVIDFFLIFFHEVYENKILSVLNKGWNKSALYGKSKVAGNNLQLICVE